MFNSNNFTTSLTNSYSTLTASTTVSSEEEDTSFKNSVIILASAVLLVSCHEKFWNLMKISRRNLLIDAARHNCPVLLKLLIRSDPNVNVQDNKGNTPLQAASDAGHLEIVKMLLKAKADPNVEGKYGNTALHLSCSKESYEITEMLLEHGAKIDGRNIYGECPLHVAAKNNKKDIVELLLRKRARVDLQDCYGDTVLHCCVEKKDRVLVDLLLDYGSDVTIANRAKWTPVEIAVIKNSVDLMNILIPLVVLEKRSGNSLENTFNTISKNQIAEKIRRRCENEIEVCSKPISGTIVSFYDVLFGSEGQVSKYARNRTLRRIFESENICFEYPIYGDIMKRKFLKAISKMKLQDECYSMLENMTEFKIPILCIEKIFSYFNVRELTDFIT